jgi:hypothetical protein
VQQENLLVQVPQRKIMTTHYQFISLGAGIPSVLTVMAPGAPTIALAGNAQGNGSGETSGGVAKSIRLFAAEGLWSLRVTTEDKEITVSGNAPVFSDYEIKLRSTS